MPGRALASSSLLHIGVGMAWILLLPALGLLIVSPVIQPAQLQEKETKLALSLPAFGSPASGSGHPANSGHKARGSASDSRPASTKTGFTFLGPQPIVSELPHHDNLIQTIKQPDIPKPPKLRAPIQAPNILQMAAPAPVLAPQTKIVELAKANNGVHIPLKTQPSQPTPNAKLTLPMSGDLATKSVNSLMSATANAPKLAPVAPAPPPVSGEGTDRRNLLVLNAMPAAGPPPAIPAGELNGSFAVSPEGNPGMNAGTVSTSAPGPGVLGSSSGSGSGKAPGSGTGTGASDSGPSAGGGASNGSGSGTGSEPGGRGGSGTGTGGGAGPAGRGSGTVGVDGSGGPGNSTFPGVSIGSAAPAVGGAPPKVPIPRGNYAMTIVATSGSGGGLGDYGIFKNEIVYTVYVDVDDPAHARPKWTLQYAGLTPASNAQIVAPFPNSKEYPHLPAQPVGRNIGRKLVVTGVINKEGKPENLRVISSPNPLLIQPLLDSLAKWTFQPAEANGEPVPVKFVLGIPITGELLNAN